MKALKYILLVFVLLSGASCTHLNKTESKKSIPIIRATAYGSFESDHLKYKNKSALGKELHKHHSLASDWSKLPVNTKLRINGQEYIVEDYGSALCSRPKNEPPTIDVYQPSRYAMNKFGLQFFTNVEIVEWGSFEESANILKDRLKYAHCRKMYNQIIQNL